MARHTALRDYSARRIALLKPSALGDIIHGLPVLAALRRRYPASHITWIVNRVYAPMLEGHPDLDSIMPFDRGASRGGLLHGVLSYARFVGELRRQRFDMVIDLQGLLRTGLMSLATGAARRVGLSTAREGATRFYTDVIPVADFNAIHAVDRYWLVAEALGVGDGPKEFHIPLAEEARSWAEDVLQGLPRPWIVLGVGSRWVTKRWPPDHFAELARRAQAQFGGSTLFVGGADETELVQATMQQLVGPCRDFSGKTSLSHLAALLARADVMIANDTGPLHLATALGRPVIAPFTCTKVLLNGPYGAEAGAVETRVSCQGSYLKRCPRMDCITELTPDRLWPLLQKVLQSWQNNRRSA